MRCATGVNASQTLKLPPIHAALPYSTSAFRLGACALCAVDCLWAGTSTSATGSARVGTRVCLWLGS